MLYGRHFRLAKELGKQLHEVMGWNGPMTSRQFDVWQVWLDIDIEIPGKIEWYLMGIRKSVEEVAIRKTVDINRFKLKMAVPITTDKSSAGKNGISVEQASAASRAIWNMRLGLIPTPKAGQTDSDT